MANPASAINRFAFSKATLSSLEKQIDKGNFKKETYIYDELSHLSILVRPEKKYIDSVFCLYKRMCIKGERKRRTYKRQIMKIGDARNTKMPIGELRKKADNLYLDIVAGRDPLLVAANQAHELGEEEKLADAKQTTREMIFGANGIINEDSNNYTSSFIAERSPSDSYITEIERSCKGTLSDLMSLPLHSLTHEQVKLVYLKQAMKGPTVAKSAMRILRAVWNWAEVKYVDSGLFLRNPVTLAMKQLNVNVNKTNARKVRLQDEDFTHYINSIIQLKEYDHTCGYRNGRDSIAFMLFSGARLTGALTIPISKIDLASKTFTIIKKGGEDACLPMNSVTEAICINRLEHLPKDVEYLFPGITGIGRYTDTRKARSKINELCNVRLTNHDLRRTYKSIGAELNINGILIDELLCHSRGGVDAHYIHPSMGSLRSASQKIADYIIEKSGIDFVGKLTHVW